MAIVVIARNSISRKKAISQIFGYFLRKVSHRLSHGFFLGNASNTIKTESVSLYDPEAL
jgi:hypothetical protein